MVLRSQPPRQESSGGWTQRSRKKHLQHERIRPRRPRNLDAVEGRVFREMKHLQAIAEGRGTTGAGVEAARIELGEVNDERHGGCALLTRQPAQLRDERAVAQS